MAKTKKVKMSFEEKMAKAMMFQGDRLKLYRKLAALTRAGVGRTDAIRMMYQVSSRDGKKKSDNTAVMLNSVMNRLKDGDSFGQAVRGWAPAGDVMVLSAIENSSDFSKNLDDYCDFLISKKAIVGIIAGGMAYPLLLFSSIYGLAVYFGRDIVPQMARLLPAEQWTGPASFLRGLKDFSDGNTAIITSGSIIAALIAITISLPIWSGAGRSVADKFPIYSLYRMYTGISFLTSVSALARSGVPMRQAIDELIPNAKPYVRKRLKAVRRGLLDGENLGQSLFKNAQGWPDPEMALSIRVFAETQDLNTQLATLANDWLDDGKKRIAKSVGVLKNLALVAVFGVLIGIVGGMYALQDQIAQALQ